MIFIQVNVWGELRFSIIELGLKLFLELHNFLIILKKDSQLIVFQLIILLLEEFFGI